MIISPSNEISLFMKCYEVLWNEVLWFVIKWIDKNLLKMCWLTCCRERTTREGKAECRDHWLSSTYCCEDKFSEGIRVLQKLLTRHLKCDIPTNQVWSGTSVGERTECQLSRSDCREKKGSWERSPHRLKPLKGSVK